MRRATDDGCRRVKRRRKAIVERPEDSPEDLLEDLLEDFRVLF